MSMDRVVLYEGNINRSSFKDVAVNIVSHGIGEQYERNAFHFSHVDDAEHFRKTLSKK